LKTVGLRESTANGAAAVSAVYTASGCQYFTGAAGSCISCLTEVSV